MLPGPPAAIAVAISSEPGAEDLAGALVVRGWASQSTEEHETGAQSREPLSSSERGVAPDVGVATKPGAPGGGREESTGGRGYLPPSPPSGPKFTVSVTFVDDSGVAYGHLLENGG